MEQAGVTAVPASQVEQGGAGGRQVDSGQNNGNNIMLHLQVNTRYCRFTSIHYTLHLGLMLCNYHDMMDLPLMFPSRCPPKCGGAAAGVLTTQASQASGGM